MCCYPAHKSHRNRVLRRDMVIQSEGTGDWICLRPLAKATPAGFGRWPSDRLPLALLVLHVLRSLTYSCHRTASPLLVHQMRNLLDQAKQKVKKAGRALNKLQSSSHQTGRGPPVPLHRGGRRVGSTAGIRVPLISTYADRGFNDIALALCVDVAVGSFIGTRRCNCRLEPIANCGVNFPAHSDIRTCTFSSEHH